MIESKKAQVTIFLIIGILLLAIFAATLYIFNYTQKQALTAEEESPLTLQVRPRIKLYVETCLYEVAVPGTYLLSSQGGFLYVDDPTKQLLTEQALINYGYLNGINQLSTEKMQHDLAQYVEETLPECINNFTLFEQEGITIKAGKIKAYPLIKNDRVVFTIKYPLTVQLGEDSFATEDFSTTLPLRLGELVSQANSIIAQHQQEPNLLDLDFLTSFDTFITTFPFDAENFVYSIYDERSTINGAPLTFVFAIQDIGTNQPPELDYLEDFILAQNTPFEYYVTASDPEEDRLTFSTNSSIITINQDTGLINLTPQTTGTYNIIITVQDTSGLQDQQEVRFIIE